MVSRRRSLGARGRVGKLTQALADKVLVQRRLTASRAGQGVFITLRQSTSTVQAVATLGSAIGKDMIKFVGQFPWRVSSTLSW